MFTLISNPKRNSVIILAPLFELSLCGKRRENYNQISNLNLLLRFKFFLYLRSFNLRYHYVTVFSCEWAAKIKWLTHSSSETLLSATIGKLSLVFEYLKEHSHIKAIVSHQLLALFSFFQRGFLISSLNLLLL